MRSASDAWPTASWMKTPVSSESIIIGKRPEGGILASSNLIAFEAVVLPINSRSSFSIASKPLAPPVLLCPN